jgi:hypothetical protein
MAGRMSRFARSKSPDFAHDLIDLGPFRPPRRPVPLQNGVYEKIGTRLRADGGGATKESERLRFSREYLRKAPEGRGKKCEKIGRHSKTGGLPPLQSARSRPAPAATTKEFRGSDPQCEGIVTGRPRLCPKTLL